MWNGKKKAVTFSFDDGVEQDIRLIEILDRYGLRCTFNLNSGSFGEQRTLVVVGKEVAHHRLTAAQARSVYQNHEVAAHTRTHPGLYDLSQEELIGECEGDRLALQELFGREIVGMAYPFGDCDERIAGVLRQHTGIRYSRTVRDNGRFDRQRDLLQFDPTAHIDDMDRLQELGEKFLRSTPQTPQLFYIWGHSYEFDAYGWEPFEAFCRWIAGRDDIFYGTNRETLLDGVPE